MEKYDEHPTWRMLEESKKAFKQQIDVLPIWDPEKFVIEKLHERLVALQYKLETRLIEEGFEK